MSPDYRRSVVDYAFYVMEKKEKNNRVRHMPACESTSMAIFAALQEASGVNT